MNRVWRVNSDEEFDTLALETFMFQATECAPYAEYLRLIGCDPQSVTSVEQIPYLPIELFKTHYIYSAPQPPEITFTSSSTTGKGTAHHHMAHLSIYESAFTLGFKEFYGKPQEWSIYGLLPSYLGREGSSLIYMVDRLITACGSGGFFMDEYDKLIDEMSRDPKPKILLGVSYALWDFAEKYAPKLHNTIVMETGGMKGYREEIDKQEFHKILCNSFGVDKIHSEYGMAELTSQAYSAGENIFYTPKWMRVSLRDINDPFSAVESGTRGGVNIIDLASRWSCSFIQTQDVGRLLPCGGFSVEGRVEASDIRGCNLLVQ